MGNLRLDHFARRARRRYRPCSLVAADGKDRRCRNGLPNRGTLAKPTEHLYAQRSGHQVVFGTCDLDRLERHILCLARTSPGLHTSKAPNTVASRSDYFQACNRLGVIEETVLCDIRIRLHFGNPGIAQLRRWQARGIVFLRHQRFGLRLGRRLASSHSIRTNRCIENAPDSYLRFVRAHVSNRHSN